jgi:NAD(P)-dependent dehydrogenase (short-subunit alcohol dehydrogenase family)
MSLETDIDAFRAVPDANVTGTAAVVLAAGRRMVADGRGGRIIVVTSIHETPVSTPDETHSGVDGVGRSWELSAYVLAA